MQRPLYQSRNERIHTSSLKAYKYLNPLKHYMCVVIRTEPTDLAYQAERFLRVTLTGEAPLGFRAEMVGRVVFIFGTPAVNSKSR